eukprot:TRINITY_DN1790_c0_g1_i1.p1 TRINITY_DN1790_c0_g1~~TRINITY_DN1790_c0_g1_i1.p1  ORF type:complete len:247 (+),score=39.63 TRINITY_DN1790_c0_g1_i1:58-798(+)
MAGTTLVSSQPTSAAGEMTAEDFELTKGKELTGLGPLRNVSSVLIQQKMNLCEILSGCEVENRFWIKSPEGETLFWAKEHSTLTQRLCCGNIRALTMTIEDQTKQSVIEIERPLKCMGFCCKCAFPKLTQEMTVRVDGETVGKVEERPTWWNQVIYLHDNSGNQVLKVRGDSAFTFCCNDVQFQVLDLDGTQVGSITKLWKGCLKETLSDADNFQLDFGNMPLAHKVLLITATFMIDFMFFEHSDN